MVQALAGLARASEDRASLDEALQLFERRDRFSFDTLWTCSEGATLVELGRASLALGVAGGQERLEQARRAVSFEARALLQEGSTG